MAAVIAVGIDPSLACTGVAIVNTGAGAPVQVQTHRFRTGKHQPELWAERYRIRRQARQVLDALPRQADVFVIEELPSRSLDATHNLRAGLYWFLVDQLWVRGPVVKVNPRTRPVYATGNGNAGKKDIIAAMRDKFPGAVIPDDNVADAVVLAAAGARWLGAPVDGVLSAKQEKAHAGMAWPTNGR